MLHFKSMTASPLDIRVQSIDHCGIVAGIFDEINLVEKINRLLGTHAQEIISAGQVVKAMILNELGFVSAPLYLFEKFSADIATEHSPTFYYQLDASLEPKEVAIAIETKRAGRFILATNLFDADKLSYDAIRFS